MSLSKKLGLGLFAFLVPLLAIVNIASADNHDPAYLSGQTIKFRNVIYTYAGEDTRANSAIRGWSIYTQQGTTFACGDQVIVDNPEATDTVALRDTAVSNQSVANPVLGPDCITVDIDTQPRLVVVNSSSLCVEAGGDWSGSACSFNSTPSTPPASTPGDASDEDAAEEDNSCESNSGPLGWIMCPVAGMLDSLTAWLDEEIQEKMIIRDSYFLGPSGDGLKAAWTQLRNIAYMILVPMMLVMVIGTALGFEVFSAYTIKRALPRMVIAVIFITFSWYIVTFLIGFTNVIGTGVKGLVTAPFQGLQSEVTDIEGPQSSLKAALTAAGIVSQTEDNDENEGLLTGTSLGIIAGLGTFAAAAGGLISIGILFSTLVSAVLILGAILLLLIARQMILIALALVAPLAILAWIFPENDKPWKLWWATFSKLLLLFPVIMLLIGVGQIFALITGIARSGEDSKLITAVIIILAYIIPYLFVPFAFRWAGGLFANLAGMVNDREKGMLDRLKKGRSEKRHELRERAGSNHRWNPNGRLGRFNNFGGWVADPKNSAAIALGTKGGRALASELTQKSAQQSADLAKWMSSAGMNQEALTAIMTNVRRNGGHLNINQLRDTANDYLTAKNDDGSFKYDTQHRAAASQLLDNASFLQNTFQSEEYGRANVGMAAGLAKAQQGFINSDPNYTNELADYSNYLNSVAPGLGNTFKTQAGLMNAQGGGLTKVGYSEQVDANGNFIAGGKAARSIQLSRTSVQELAGAKSSQIKRHFLENGALDSILNTAHNGDIEDAGSGEKIKITDGRKQTVLDTIAQAAYGYNTPAETAETLRAKLNDIAVNHSDENIRKMARDATARASRDPSLFGGLDKQPPPEE